MSTERPATPAEIGEQLDRLFTIFRPPFRSDDPRWVTLFREYVEVCQGFGFGTLKAGIDALILSRKDRQAPTPAEVVDAIRTTPVKVLPGQSMSALQSATF